MDESGDFGEFDSRAPFYILFLVLHDQKVDIKDDLTLLESEMRNIGWPDHCIHAGPIIRAEYEYKECSLHERQQIIRRLMTFTRKLDIRYISIYVEKKKELDEIELTGKLSRQLADLVRQNTNFFAEYDIVKLTELKLERHILSKSEQYFFQDDRTLRKNYLKPLDKKQL